MGQVEHFPEPRQVEREASDWIARLQAPDAGAEDRERFQSWLTADPQHARVYEELTATWRRFERAGAIADSVEDLISAATVQPRRRWAIPASIAASLAIVAMTLWWLNSAPPSNLSLRTAVGEQTSAALPDGSVVALNTDSHASVSFTNTARVVRLERGEAHFEVARDLRRPFWVTAGNTWIRAVGTEFDVLVGPRAVEVLVTEGRVKVTTASQSGSGPTDAVLVNGTYSVLIAGQKIAHDGSVAQIHSISPRELRRSKNWRAGKLEFEDQTLDEVIAELSRYTSLQLIIDDEQLRRVRVGGTFKASDEGVNAVLALLQQGWGVELRREPPNRVYLTVADD